MTQLQSLCLLLLIATYSIFLSFMLNLSGEQDILIQMHDSFTREQMLMERLVTRDLQTTYAEFDRQVKINNETWRSCMISNIFQTFQKRQKTL